MLAHRKQHRIRTPKRIAIALVVAIASSLVGMAVAQAPAFVSIGTASASGAYYPLGVAMADLWNRAIPGTRFSAQETGGSVANMNMIAGSEIEVGIANENVAWDAQQANAPFTAPIDLLGGWVLNKSYGVFVAAASSNIDSLADLAGKKVALGAPGSSANLMGAAVLRSQGLEEGDYSVVYMGWQESADAIADGFIDAAMMVGGQPFPAIESLAVRTPVRLLSFDASKLANLEGFPLSGAPTPEGVYGTTEQGTQLVIRSNIYIAPDLDEDLVYQMVKTVFENIPVLESAHPSGDEAELISRAYAEQLGLTMHPGVIRYATEVGAW